MEKFGVGQSKASLGLSMYVTIFQFASTPTNTMQVRDRLWDGTYDILANE